jgi:predicted alpha/beta-fold hydrolase
VTFRDGGQASLDWALPTDLHNKAYEPPEETKLLFIVHGLTGGSNVKIIIIFLIIYYIDELYQIPY